MNKEQGNKYRAQAAQDSEAWHLGIAWVDIWHFWSGKSIYRAMEIIQVLVC